MIAVPQRTGYRSSPRLTSHVRNSEHSGEVVRGGCLAAWAHRGLRAGTNALDSPAEAREVLTWPLGHARD
jgi:hypothetical protein